MDEMDKYGILSDFLSESKLYLYIYTIKTYYHK